MRLKSHKIACKQSLSNKGYGSLLSNACIPLQYDLGWRNCSITVPKVYDAVDDEGIGLTFMTSYTPLHYRDIIWDELL